MPAETLIVIVLALVLGALVKGISGLGLPLVAVPVMAGFLGVERAVVIMVIPAFFVQSWLVWAYRHELPALPSLWRMLAAGIAGVAAGSWILAAVSERWLVLVMALWVGLYLVSIALGVDPWRRLRQAKVGGPLAIMAAGTIQGATGVSGPLVASYMHALRLQKGAYILCANVIFQVFMLAQFASLAGLGLMTWPRIQEGLLACLPVAMVLPVAIRISRRISQRLFNRLVVGLLVVMEIRLVFRLVGALE